MMDEIHILEDSVKNWVLILYTYVIALILGAAVLMFFNTSEAAEPTEMVEIRYIPTRFHPDEPVSVQLFAITDEEVEEGFTFFDNRNPIFSGSSQHDFRAYLPTGDAEFVMVAGFSHEYKAPDPRIHGTMLINGGTCEVAAVQFHNDINWSWLGFTWAWKCFIPRTETTCAVSPDTRACPVTE